MSFVSRGKGTYQVPLALHKENRTRLYERLTKLSETKTPNSAVLLQGGTEDRYAKYDTDGEFLFRQESYFRWAFGAKEPGLYGAILLSKPHSVLFVPRVPERLVPVLGQPPSLQEYRDHYEVDEVYYVDEMKTVLKDNLQLKTLYTLKGVNTDSGNESIPTHFAGIEEFEVDSSLLHYHITELRVFKTAREIELMKYINSVSSQGHIECMKNVKIGAPEFHFESTFKHFVHSTGGFRHLAYTPICCSGVSGAVLHYGHAALPNDQTVESGHMILLDMGGEYHGYASDITCSFPSNGKFTPEQKVVYEAVLDAQKSVNEALKPGVLWSDMHHLAYSKILGGLKAAGIVQGDIEEMIKAELGGIFMPHGLGHFLGLDTHDVGGYPPGCKHERIMRPGFRSLRTARPLEEGMVLTNEPGCYFIKSLLDKALADPEQSKFLNKEKIDQYRNFGGVRLEDNVIITKDGIDNMTKVPRTVEEIEKVMAK